MMNLGYFEIMDRIAVIQNQLEISVASHQEITTEVYELIQEAQDKLSDAYQEVGRLFDESCDDDE